MLAVVKIRDKRVEVRGAEKSKGRKHLATNHYH